MLGVCHHSPSHNDGQYAHFSRDNAPTGGKRGAVNGWSRSSVRRHEAWLSGVDVSQLDGSAYGVTWLSTRLWVGWLRDRSLRVGLVRR